MSPTSNLDDIIANTSSDQNAHVYANTIIINQEQDKNIQSSGNPLYNYYDKFCNRLSSTQNSIDDIVEEFIDEDWTVEDTIGNDKLNSDFIEPFQYHHNPQSMY